MKKVALLMNALILRNGWTFALLLLMPLWFNSCKSDGGDGPDPVVTPNGVAGSWKISGMKVNPAIDLGNGTKTSDMFTLFQMTPGGADALACLTDTKITFNSNGTISGTPSPKCKSESADDLNPAQNNSRWKVEGNKLIITESDGTSMSYGLTVNGSSMKWDIQDQDDLDGDGKMDTYTTTIEFTKA